LGRVRALTQQGRDIDLVPGVYEWDRHKGVFQPNYPRAAFHSADEHQFAIWFPEEGSRVVAVPYAALRSAWVTADQRMGIMLSVRIVRNSSEFRLQPL
jgi:hypothetical protein